MRVELHCHTYCGHDFMNNFKLTDKMCIIYSTNSTLDLQNNILVYDSSLNTNSPEPWTHVQDIVVNGCSKGKDAIK